MSMALHEVENIDREVKRSLKEIEDEIKKIESGMAPSSASQQVSKKIKHTNSRIKTMEIELQTVSDREAAKKFKPVIREHRNKLKEFEQSLQWSSSNAAVNDDEVNADDIMNNEDNAIAYGKKLQDETANAADNAIQTLAETTDVATGTAQMVHDQTGQIERIDANLAEIDDEIDRATKILKRMGRRVMTDKYIWILIGLLFVAIIAIIVVSVVNGKVKEDDLKPNIRRRMMSDGYAYAHDSDAHDTMGLF